MKYLIVICVCLLGCGQSNFERQDSRQYDSPDEQRAYDRIRQEGYNDEDAARITNAAKKLSETNRKIRQNSY